MPNFLFRRGQWISGALAFSSKLERFWTGQMPPWLMGWFAQESCEELKTSANIIAFSQALAEPCR
jgi:hypothetical protein